MIAVSKKIEWSIASVGVMVLLLILFWPEANNLAPNKSALEIAADTLKGRGFVSDLAQDVIGFRAMVRQENAYPILESAADELGLNWEYVNHASTHPPTAFLFLAPIAFWSWPVVSMVWGWLMLGLLVLAFRIYGLPWLVAFGLTPVAVLWPPLATSLGQFTIIWLLGFAIGYRYLLRRKYFLSGIGIGLAALTKIVPGVMIILFLSKKRWQAILGLALMGLVSLISVVLISPNSLNQYAIANRLNSVAMILRADNASLLGTAYRWGGWLGEIPVLVFLGLILWANRSFVLSRSASFPSTDLWMLLTYFSVTLLPISWIYSLAPLLPVIIFLLWKRKLSTLFAGFCCVIIPFLFPIRGVFSVVPLVSVNVLLGVGLIFNALPFRLFTARSVGSLLAKSAE